MKAEAKRSVRKNLPRYLNAAIWVDFCAMVGSGLLLAWRLPPGSRGGRGLSALGWDRHEWGDLHTWLAYAFVLLVLMHLALHWRWLWQVASRRRGWTLWLGIGGGLALIVFLFSLPVERNDHEGQGGHHQRGK